MSYLPRQKVSGHRDYTKFGESIHALRERKVGSARNPNDTSEPLGNAKGV